MKLHRQTLGEKTLTLRPFRRFSVCMNRSAGVPPAAATAAPEGFESPSAPWRKLPQRPGVPRPACQSGVALVATLIMLSLVTFMVVAFLSVARRERQSVAASLTINEARAAMEAGMARAQADLAARMFTFGDPWSYGLMVPTNFQNSVFNAAVIPANISPTNVNDILALQAAGQPTPWLLHLGNLQYDARVPVFSPLFNNTTPFAPLRSESNLGRYYLDFNRDRMFETTDSVQTGDPHWIGMLEYPHAPHSATNLFTSRYTYLLVPAGKTLDANMIHNQARRVGAVTTENYIRNLNLGPQEMNLAALLAELNPQWGYNYDPVTPTPTAGFAFSDALGLLLFRNTNGFNSAATLTAQFGASAAANLVASEFDVLGDGPLMGSTNLTVNVDPVNIQWPGGSNASVTAQRMFDMNELFAAGRSYSGNLTTNLQFISTNNQTATVAGDASRRTYFNLLSTLGVDSWPQTDKLNINWQGTRFLYWSNSAPGAFELAWSNAPSASVGGDYFGFTNWAADSFFNTAAEMMIRASITPSVIYDTNWSGFGGGGTSVLFTNYWFGNLIYSTNASQVFSISNIQVFPPNFYRPEVHRILQLAANILDATTTNGAAPAYPTVFRPLFAFNSNGWPNSDIIRIIGYTTNSTDASSLLSLPLVDLNDPNSRLQMYNTPMGSLGGSDLCLVSGIPVILGAKKGYPNFNEFASQSIMSVTRRLEFVKTNATNIGPLSASGLPLTWTNQSLILSLTNINGFEVWNSYTGAFPRALQLVATNVSDVAVGYFLNRHLPSSAEQFSSTNFLLLYTNRTVNGVAPSFGANTWLGTANLNSSFKSFLFTTTPQLSTNAAAGYAFATNYPALPGFTNGGFAPASPVVSGLAVFNRTNGFPDLQLHITVTNSIRYALIEPAANRVVDFVTLANMVVGTNMTAPKQLTMAGVGAKLFHAFHGITNGVEVRFYTTGLLPAPLLMGVSYYVRDSTVNDFNVAATPTGAAIPLGLGTGPFWVILPTVENLGLALGTGGTNNGGQFWLTTGRVGGNVMARTDGISNQIAMCLDTNIFLGSSNATIWRQYSLNTPVLREIDRFRKWMGTNGPMPANQAMNTNVTSIQSPFNPTRVVSLSATWEANDPLVHTLLADLESQFLPLLITNHPARTAIAPPGSLYRVDFLTNRFFTNYAVNFAFQPWGTVPDITRYAGFQNIASFRNAQGQGYYAVAPPAFDQRLKDPGVFRSDEWNFPQRKFANLGWLGRVHRGTPWQTFYLKSDAPNPTNWLYWAHSVETNPTNDWRLAEVFTAAIDSEATRGLLSVNQTNPAAWSAALSGTLVLSNNFNVILPRVIAPASAQLTNIMGNLTSGLMNTRLSVPMWSPTANYSSNDIVAYWSAPILVPGDAVPQLKRYFRALNATNYVQSPNVGQDPYVQTSFPSLSYTYWTNVLIWTTNNSYAPGTWVVFRDVSYLMTNSAVTSTSDPSPNLDSTHWEMRPLRSFTKAGYVLRTPELSVQSPYLNVGRPWVARTYAAGERAYWQGWYYQAVVGVPANQPPNPYLNYADLRTMVQTYWWPLESPFIARNGNTVDSLNDVFIERIPQQTLGLMNLEPNPRVVIYAYGQSLKPAERGVYVGGGPFQGMATNYQVTGEQVSRSVVRIDGLPEPGLLPSPVLPSAYPVTLPTLVFPRFIVESFKLVPADF